MDINAIVEDIKNSLKDELIKNKISSDLGLSFKHDKCLCFLHSEKHPSMSFDKNNKRFKCFSCGRTYDIFNHYQEYRHLNFVQAIENIIKDFNLNIQYEPLKSDNKPIKKATEHDKDLKDILPYLNLRKITEDTIRHVGLKANGNKIVFEYRNELGEHVANKYRIAAKVTQGNKMWFESGTNINTLFNMDKINPSEPLIITEGEIDCLALIECGIKNTVSIPTGANSTEWIDVNYKWLEQFKEVILWFDNDNPGIEGMRNVSPRIPANTVKSVKSNKAKDINEILYKYGKEIVIEELNKAEEPPIQNIASPSDIEDFNVFEAKKIKTGFKMIDDTIYGYVLGSINVLTGYNGSGKSTILNQTYIAEAISQGFKTFIFSGELTKPNLMYWLTMTLAIEDQIIKTNNKDGKSYSKVSDPGKKMIKKWLDNKLFIYDNDTDFTAKTILNTMDKLAKKKDVKCFVLDNLMTIDLECRSNEELNAQKDFVRDLKKFAVKYNAVVHLVAHPRKGDENTMVSKMDVCGSGTLTNMADYVTAIHRYTDEQREKGEHDFDASLMLFKNRPTGNTLERGTGLYYDSIRKRFYKDTTNLKKDYGYTKGYEAIEIELGGCPF